jgi:D-alanine-D-alanine ligase
MRVLTEALRVLKPWGKILIDSTDGEYVRKHFQPRSWEWIDKRMFVCRERSLSIDGQRLISREVVTDVEKGVLADQFYGERLYTAKSLTELLRKAGFSNIAVHGPISPESQRNQDLGMMERRIIISAVAKKEWAPVRRRKKAVRKVVVLLGDPSKADPLKPLCVFDEDDYYTIDQMKSALHGLKTHHFRYLTGHDRFIHDLMSLKPKTDLVLNLCDEGYNNNPRHELHVPAILEMIGIPYTGAGPQCLGICYDKSLTRGVAQEMGIPVPEAAFIKPEDNILEITFPFPVIVKPNFGDSSFGITQKSVCGNVEQLVDAITTIRERFGYEKPILVEEFLTGKDISVGIIGNPPDSYRVLPVIEEDYSALPPELPRVCGYEAKWLPDSPYWNIKSIPAELPDDTEKLLVECCLKLFTRLECRDYCRFDWRLNAAGAPRLLEVNPNPGWCWDGHLAKMAKITGLSYREMLAEIIDAAEQRLGLKARS